MVHSALDFFGMVGIEGPGGGVGYLGSDAGDIFFTVGFRRPTMTCQNLGRAVSSLHPPWLVGALRFRCEIEYRNFSPLNLY